MKNKSLFNLIHSLGGNEKRYVSIYLKSRRDDSNLMKLYTIISKTRPVNDDIIKNKLNDAKIISQLAATKHILYTRILDALHNYHLQDSPYGQILNLLHQADILSNKNLVKERNEILEKAEKIADKYELGQLKLEILRLMDVSVPDALRAKSLHNKTKKVAKTILKESKAKYSYNRMVLTGNIGILGSRLTSVQFRTVKDFFESIALPKGQESFFYHYVYLGAASLYDLASGNKLNAYKTQVKQFDFLKNQPAILQTPLWKERYLFLLVRLVSSSWEAGNKELSTRFYNEILRLDISDTRKAVAIINMLDNYIQTADFEESRKLLQQVESNIRYYESNIVNSSQLLALYGNLALLNFGMGKYAQSNKWLSIILNSSEVYEDLSLFKIARILRLINYYEMERYDELEYMLRSTYRYMMKQKVLFRFDDILLKFIRKLIRVLYNHDKMIETMSHTRNALIKLSKNRTEGKTLYYFDFISWLESKIQNRPFAEIVKEKQRN